MTTVVTQKQRKTEVATGVNPTKLPLNSWMHLARGKKWVGNCQLALNMSTFQNWMGFLGIFVSVAFVVDADPEVPQPAPAIRRLSATTNLPAAPGPAVSGGNLSAATAYRPLSGPPPESIMPVKPNPKALAFDSLLKTFDGTNGVTKAEFSFSVTNVSSEDVIITRVQTSCGCTAAQLPSQPWKLAPGDSGKIGVTVDLTGKYGTVNKTATVLSSAGSFPLSVRMNLPSLEISGNRMDRSRNLQIAAVDRQAVFRGDCATCHVTPTLGKKGHELYDTACGICHDAANRASMVPQLHALTKPTDAAYWTQWIRNGKEHTFMPAFALKSGGILSDDQVQSLVEYLDGDFKLQVHLDSVGANPLPNPVSPAPK